MTDEVEKIEDFGKTKQGTWRRWDRELELALKKEKDWRSDSEKVLRIYRSESETSVDRTGSQKSKSTFNILWSNIETTRPALYNQTPKVNVARRYKDEDALGKAISQVLDRALDFMMDYTDFDGEISRAVLDLLLPGRSITRVRYKPVFEGEGDDRVVTGESVDPEQVQWDDFCHGPARKWDDVQWIAFKHKLNMDQLEQLCGKELAKKIHLDVNAHKEEGEELSEDDATILKRATVWEIWDKKDKKVKFWAKGYKDNLIKVVDDPLNLSGFFPIARPMLAVEDSSSLVPICEYSQYMVLANELNLVTQRIIRITKAIRYRGVYDGTLKEIGQLMESDDNSLIPLESAVVAMDSGGLDRAIWIMPVEQLANVLIQLYGYRDSLIQQIYEVTGTSDIMRGATEKSETATAQSIKSQWGSQRLQRRQREVQRYARDTIRIMSEIIAEKFSIETLKKMTGLKFPMREEKQQAQMMMQAAQQMGQQIPPEQMEQAQSVLTLPAWEDIKEAMSQDLLREYKVDVETDSTIAGDVQEDRKNVQELLGGIVEFMNGIAPAVQSGVVPMETAKALLMAGVRRFKLGSEVEDALDKIGGEAKEGPSPEQQQAKADAMLAQQKEQREAQNQMFQAEAKKKELEQRDRELTLKEREIAAKYALEDKKIGASKLEEGMTEFKSTQDVMGQIFQQSQQSTDAALQMSNAALQATEQNRAAIDALSQTMTEIAKSINAPKRLVKDAQGYRSEVIN